MQGLLLSLLLVGPPQDSPPGLRLVAGGATKVGSRVADVERWLREGERTFANFLAGETPQFETDVEDFHLMVTEVTREQYAAYVEATGVRPPFHWSPGPVDAARQAFLEEEGRRESDPTKRRTWDPNRWWDEHWEEGHGWVSMEGALPVVNVSQREAAAYARWAGLRLMSEAEFARAGRGDTGRLYPWGDEWDEAACNSVLLELGGRVAVGTFPGTDGLFDLVGNVWEWTRSPYRPFAGYELLRVKVQESTRSFEVEALAPFDPARRVAVGGSFLQGRIGLHVASRRAKPPGAREPYLGFRCAASSTPGPDAALGVIDAELERSVVPDAELDASRAAIHQRWTHRPGTAGVPGYALITGWERVLFCPVRTLGVGTRIALQRKSTDDGPVLLGLLSTSLPVQEPALDPGTYLVTWRAPGKVLELDPLASLAGLDLEVSCLVLFDMGGLPVAAVRAAAADFGRLRGSSTVAEHEGSLRFTLVVPGERREGLTAELQLRLLQDR